SNNFDLYENSQGIMWILSGNGIHVLRTDALLENNEIRPVHYGIANGLPCTATSNSYSELAEDGSLYISGASGVVKVNIEEPMENISELRQAVPYIDADGVRLFPDETGAFAVPSNVRKLTIYGFVFNYSLTDPRVSYFLDGFDLEKTTVNRSNLEPVTYTNLPGETYRFIMELEDSTGQTSKTLSVPIIKAQALYEMTWFYILIGTAAVLATVVLARLYTRRKMLALENRHREEANRDRIVNELKMAAQIQESMLPHTFPPFPDRREFDLFAVMNPAREVGGDFYDFFLIDDDHLCLVIADVSGKGIPAALFMMVSKVILESFATMGASAADILRKMNEAVCSNNQAEMFVTVWLGILEIHSGKLTSANAGHEYPAIRRSGGCFELEKTKHSLVIGGMEGIQYREFETQLQPGDTLFVYTDGVPEATDAENNMFGTDRMISALNKDPDAGPRQLLENVYEDVNLFTGNAEQFDDLTMLCLEYHGA
ncbi:MAG: PP2C family protein-serine/threonine phosphatase, partial [Lachnospiraceae bacterium]|nr:PP2C family protein-serine/threonine phosphatase [Lachnospiraceae bacterium]